MSIEAVRTYLQTFGLDDRIIEFSQSSATVEQAAQANHCDPARIAKTLSFLLEDRCILIVAAGDAKIDNGKYKARFGHKAKMVAFDDVEERVGHAAGGVCPFAVKDNVDVYLDESLKRFDIVFPAAGNSSSAVRLTPAELEKASASNGWVDVCKGWNN
ncbi:YbaK/EbsC family protein [uncultured Ruthenibacterium sp.]|uniref:YbaK/EbsC family protein n=1 Tax=uncultured Ruthenibacterium sp. TaxID=1905347 RepID=UPI00349EF9BE